MKKIFFVLILLIVSFALVLSSCKKKDETPETNSITPEQVQAIKTGYSEVDPILNDALLSADPILAFKQSLAVIKTKTAVEDAWADSSSMYVKFKNGGIIIWSIVPEIDTTSPAVNLKALAGDPILVGNKFACLFNQQYDDEDRPYCRAIIEELYQNLTDHGYTVTIRNGTDVNLSFIKNNLADYGAVFYISHGNYSRGRTYIYTGENAGSLPIDSIVHKYYPEWEDNQIAIGKTKELRNNKWQIISNYIFNDKYIDNKFEDKAFPSSLMYFVACQGFKDINGLALSMEQKGAGVVMGWTETNCKGQETGKIIFDYLLEGYTVGEIFSTLLGPSGYAVCNCSGVPAYVQYFPISGSDYCLVKKTNVVTMAATNIAATTVTLNATINPQGSATNGTFEYGLTTEYGNFIQCVQNPMNGNQSVAVSVDLSGLLSETTYHFRIKASIQSGVILGKDLTFKTLEGVMVETKAATNVTTTSATLNATINPAGETTNGTFEYGLTTAYGSIMQLSQNPLNGNQSIPVSVVLSGLVSNSYYHFRIKATNQYGDTFGNDLSFKTLDGTLHIGQSYQGGKIFYIDGTGQHGLIAAPDDQSAGAPWGCIDNLIGTSTALGTGQANTLAIINGCSDAGTAARICYDLVLNGYSDWFLPSKDELSLMYPYQNLIGHFQPVDYYSSSESSAHNAWEQLFSNASQYTVDKYTTCYVRPVRAF